ncbi:universal stress protein [Halioxenophilus sp. WMMB6]|uniref:universal stress protein n=1 Tax=Halioxenophilus sp. WMMB6 TaxID=3073815 RepID=UPI00295E7FA3|nr:universal stress protein [Halioxenophilus sp. WMMB6]
MTLEKKILVAVDPTKSKQLALELSTNVASLHLEEYSPTLNLLVGIDPGNHDTSADNEALYRDKTYFEQLVAPLNAAGLATSVRVSWSNNWADSLIYNAQQLGADSIMVSHPGADSNRDFSDEFWHLLRNSPIPVSLISSADTPACKNILVAIDISDEKLTDLNQRMLSTGRTLAKIYGAQLHIAYAYPSSMDYPDRGRLGRALDIPNENLHLAQGSPDEALREISAELKPDTIILGATRRSGIRAALRGRKLAEILNNIKHNMYVVV